MQHSSGLTIAIAGIFKEVLTIGAGVAILGDEMSTRKALGLLLCLVGIGLYHRITTAVRDHHQSMIYHRLGMSLADHIHRACRRRIFTCTHAIPASPPRSRNRTGHPRPRHAPRRTPLLSLSPRIRRISARRIISPAPVDRARDLMTRTPTARARGGPRRRRDGAAARVTRRSARCSMDRRDLTH